MDREILYHLSMGIIGTVFAITGLWNISSMGVSRSAFLMVIGGVVLVVSTALQWTSPSEFDPGRSAWISGIGALLVLTGSLMSFLL